MAKITGLGQGLFINGADVSGDVGAINEAGITREVHPNQGIDKSAIARQSLRSDGRIDFAGWFNDATEALFKTLQASGILHTADVLVTYAMSAVRGDPAFMLVAKQTDVPFDRGPDGSLAVQATFEGTGGVAPEWGVMISAGLETHASATSKASVDNGGSSANGAAAMIQIDDIDSGTPTFVLQDSANDSTFATLISFTAVASGGEPAAERKTVSGTVDQFTRITTTGTFSNADAVIAMRRGTSSDDVAYT